MATAADEPRLRTFIHDHWSSNHIFVERPEVFRWQHQEADGRFNMVLAEDDAVSGDVLGVLGFIPFGRFSPSLGDRDVLLAIWKVRDDDVPPGVGLRLLKYLERELRPRLIGAIGTSQMVRRIYTVLGYTVGSLSQAALFAAGRSESPQIATGVPPIAFGPVRGSPGLELSPWSSVAPEAMDAIWPGAVPTKSWEYVEQRFVRHPWFDYEVRVATVDGRPLGIVVWRAVAARGSRALRIVDLIGDPAWIAGAGPALRRELTAADAEYIDVMHWGLDDGVLEAAGFVTVDTYPDLVIPNYFAPFEPRNVEIELAFKVLSGDSERVTLFRGDSDQDRPNTTIDVDRPV
jgi:hypothetical protein